MKNTWVTQGPRLVDAYDAKKGDTSTIILHGAIAFVLPFVDTP